MTSLFAYEATLFPHSEPKAMATRTESPEIQTVRGKFAIICSSISAPDVVKFAGELLQSNLISDAGHQAAIAVTGLSPTNNKIAHLVSEAEKNVCNSPDNFYKFVSIVESRNAQLASTLRSQYMHARPGPSDSGDSPEYLTVLRHIADINQRIPPAERSTVADKLLQAGLITAASHTNATAIGTGIPHSQLISSLMAEAMARIKTCSRLFYSLITILRTIDDTFATELTTECCECPNLSYITMCDMCVWSVVRLGGSSVVEIASTNQQGTHLSQGMHEVLG